MNAMFTQRDLVRIIANWVPLALVGTVLIGAVFLAVQQDLRQGANDPQIQMAQDTAAVLKSGTSIALAIPSAKVDPSKSLAPFVIVYGSNGSVVMSQASIGGQAPSLPSGVLDNAKVLGESRVTWQTADGTRIAAVIEYYDGPNSGYVLAGRSLREVERRVDVLNFQMGMLWIFAMLGSLSLVGVLVWAKGWLKGRD